MTSFNSTFMAVAHLCNTGGADIAPYVPWKISVYRKVLTQDPDFEDGCQDYVFIHASEVSIRSTLVNI